MPAKKPPKMHERIERVWTNHPVISLSTIVGIVTLLSLLAPAVWWTINHFQTVDEARRTEVEIRRNMAWMTVQSIKTETIALRNRVNDCDIKNDKKELMTRLERQACDQYQQEFDDATLRFNKAKDAAMAFGKEK